LGGPFLCRRTRDELEATFGRYSASFRDGGNTLATCFNPQCKRELLYLREGRVMRVVTKQADCSQVEHFWLCANCYRTYDFCFSTAAGVSLVLRSRRGIDDFHRSPLIPADIRQEQYGATAAKVSELATGTRLSPIQGYSAI
jgi:hypothetical protein